MRPQLSIMSLIKGMGDYLTKPTARMVRLSLISDPMPDPIPSVAGEKCQSYLEKFGNYSSIKIWNFELSLNSIAFT